MKSDVVVIGGGIIGSSAAYFLAKDPRFKGTITVVEPDDAYERASTARSAASLRQQFALTENIRMARFGFEFIRSANSDLAISGLASPEISFVEAGYLMLVTEAQVEEYSANLKIQHAEGVEIVHLSPHEIQRAFPWLSVDGISLGSRGLSGEGWFDALQLLLAVRRKAQSLGVRYLANSAESIDVSGGRARGVGLASGSRISCGAIVNAAGARARSVAAMAGISAPIESRKRCIFPFSSPTVLKNCPFIFDPTAGVGGFYFRPDGDRFICATAPDPASDREDFGFEVDRSLFQDVILPAMQKRIPSLKDIVPQPAWAGHYDYNTYDLNALIGPKKELENFYFLNGFSGHGVMHAPAAGRAVSELIVDGQFQTLDLTLFSPNRIDHGGRLRDLQCCEPASAQA